MIRSILFPTDFSSVANSAFPLAVAIAAQFDAVVQSVHIAHGGDPHITETSRYEFPALPTGATAVRVIQTIIPKEEDDPAQIIMRCAAEREGDLIVMASHGRSDVAQFFLGRSVAEQVARDSKVPTIIARLHGPRRTTRPIDRFATIVFATDLSEKSKVILPVATAIARQEQKQKVERLCVFGEGDEEPADGGKDKLERFLKKPPRLRCSAKCGGFTEASPKPSSNMRAGHKADLIAITTTLCCGGDERLTGTAEFIIRNAPCPVLCVRP